MSPKSVQEQIKFWEQEISPKSVQEQIKFWEQERIKYVNGTHEHTDNDDWAEYNLFCGDKIYDLRNIYHNLDKRYVEQRNYCDCCRKDIDWYINNTDEFCAECKKISDELDKN